jgi:hypothetical protein
VRTGTCAPTPRCARWGELFEPTTEYARAHLAVALETVRIHPPSQGRKVLASFMMHVAGPAFAFNPHYLS